MAEKDADAVERQCSALQEDELTVLESIYPGAITTHANPTSKPGRLLRMDISVSLPNPLATHLTPSLSQPSSSSTVPSLELSHLPALSLRLILPPAYPLCVPPKVVSLRAPLQAQDMSSGNWLNRSCLRSISDQLGRMWEEEKELAGEGSGVIWKWWEWIGNGEFLSDLSLIQDGQLSLSVPPMIPPSTFHTLLKTYNASQLHSSFEATAFSCSICLENRKGKSCVQMPGCGCVFCTPCLNSCWTLAISEGTLENVSCPSVSCVKRRATRDARPGASQAGAESQSVVESDEVDPELVQSVVGKDLRDRWESLIETRRAEIDPSYTVCPQPKCQAAVPPPPEPTPADLAAQSAISSRVIRLSDLRAGPSSPTSTVSSASPITPITPAPAPAAAAATAGSAVDDRWTRYRCCPKCQFSFCLYCSATWHGPHTPCSFPQTSVIVQEYLSYPEGSDGRRRMEMMRGKNNLERMVAKWKEDEENRKWLDARTRACGGCGVRVEKSHGCNHMTCGRCNSHFCYRCGASLSPQDPYAHYRHPGTSCFERLFDQEEIERFERETAMGVAGMGGMDGLPFVDGDEWREVRGIWEW